MKIYVKSEFYVGLVWIISAVAAIVNMVKGQGTPAFNNASLFGSVILMLAFFLDSTCRVPIFSLGSGISTEDLFEKSGHAIKKVTMVMVRIAFYGGILLGLFGIFGLAKLGNPNFKSFALMGGPIALLATAEFRFMINRYISKDFHV